MEIGYRSIILMLILYVNLVSKINTKDNEIIKEFEDISDSEFLREISIHEFTEKELELIQKLGMNTTVVTKDSEIVEEFLKNKNLGNADNRREFKLTYSEKVINAGFEFEEHKIITGDGYILTAWRIPRKKGTDRLIKNPPIVLQHGLMDDSWTWLALNNSTYCLGILLADRNYDVWLTNSRGNMFSYEHINPDYDPFSFKSNFWNFTWHDMAKYDLKANVEYIKNASGFDKLKWIGHSQGTFQFFLSYTMDPKYMENNFDKFLSIGTVATIFNTVNFILNF
jgi:hypothetical protein